MPQEDDSIIRHKIGKRRGNPYLDFIAKFSPDGPMAAEFKADLDRLIDWKYTHRATDFSKEEIARFWSRVDKNGPIIKEELGPCWVWKNVPAATGYGIWNVNGVSGSTHRIAWQITHGPIPTGIIICHKCDHRRCCRPEHLFADTHKANMADMVNKERQAWGIRHWKTKLSEEAVQDIRIRGDSGVPEIKVELSRQYKVKYACIDKITKGQLWKSLPWPTQS